MRQLITVIFFLLASLAYAQKPTWVASYLVNERDTVVYSLCDTIRIVESAPSIGANSFILTYGTGSYWFTIWQSRDQDQWDSRGGYWVRNYYARATFFDRIYWIRKITYGDYFVIWIVPSKFHHSHDITLARGFMYTNDPVVIRVVPSIIEIKNEID